jgi:broad specificity phosphatase PhoE
MKSVFIAIFSLLLLQQSMAQLQNPVGKNGVIYIVRHAEKESGKDPLLTTEGNRRAGDLMRTLNDKHIKKIFVSEFKRTQNTADSMRLQLGSDTVHYIADTNCTDLFNSIRKNNIRNNKPILIISHSNIIQKIIYKLGINDFPQQNIGDTEFDNLFIIRYKNNVPKLEQKKYGKTSGASATMMK